jgi:transcriptional regulator with XRE-family HTH domain
VEFVVLVRSVRLVVLPVTAEWASPHPSGGDQIPSPFHGDRLKALRTEHGWPQAELAEKIDSDARQVSRYENSKVAPGLEAVIRIAETFNITIDYLLFNNAERRPLNTPSNHLDARLANLDQPSDEERTTITNVINVKAHQRTHCRPHGTMSVMSKWPLPIGSPLTWPSTQYSKFA